MGIKIDYLRLLYAICKGKISVNANDHRDVYDTVEEQLAGLAKHNPEAVAAITPEVRAEMVATNTLIRVDLVPNNPEDQEEELCFIGATLEKVLEVAYERMKELRIKGCAAWAVDGANWTDTLAELIATAKCSVTLDINPFKAKHWDIEKQCAVYDMHAKEYLRDLLVMNPDRFEADEDGDAEITPGLGQQMVDRNEVFELSFYPSTPIGFYTFMHVDLPGMLDGALTLCKKDVLAMGALG